MFRVQSNKAICRSPRFFWFKCHEVCIDDVELRLIGVSSEGIPRLKVLQLFNRLGEV